MSDRRRILWHAFALLTVAFALGLVVGPLGARHHPHARLWLGAHVTGLMIGMLLIGVGLVRPLLRLGPRAGRVFFHAAVGGNWLGMLVLGIFGSIVGAPAPVAAPHVTPAGGWQGAVLMAGILIVTVTTFTMCGLGLYGLRGPTDPGGERSAG